MLSCWRCPVRWVPLELEAHEAVGQLGIDAQLPPHSLGDAGDILGHLENLDDLSLFVADRSIFGIQEYLAAVLPNPTEGSAHPLAGSQFLPEFHILWGCGISLGAEHSMVGAHHGFLFSITHGREEE